MVCKRCIVTGKVQGVWFRGSAQREAQRLGVTGHALNRVDGAVEVLACGEDAAVAALIEWLGHGPPLAQVDGVAVEEHAGAVPPVFSTR